MGAATSTRKGILRPAATSSGEGPDLERRGTRRRVGRDPVGDLDGLRSAGSMTGTNDTMSLVPTNWCRLGNQCLPVPNRHL
uniref:Uncharacterized protein n=1 Tax=Oryza glumipatula TaxID=40148 RepID=A0A0E0B9X1_9ORYZ